MIVSQLAEEAVLQLQWELIHLDPTLVVQTKVDEQLLCKTPGVEKYSQVIKVVDTYSMENIIVLVCYK